MGFFFIIWDEIFACLWKRPFNLVIVGNIQLFYILKGYVVGSSLKTLQILWQFKCSSIFNVQYTVGFIINSCTLPNMWGVWVWPSQTVIWSAPHESGLFMCWFLHHLGWSLYEDSDGQTRIINCTLAKAEACKVHADRLCVHVFVYSCVCVCARIGLMHTQTSSSLGRLTQPLTPLAHQAAEPSGWEILSEWRRWEAHLPSSTDSVWVRWDAALCVCMCVYVYVSVWCLRPSGLQIIVNVPGGSFHTRSSGQCQCQVTETRRINQDWRVKRGRCMRLCHQSERHLMGNAHKCAMLPVWSTYSPWQWLAMVVFKNAASILDAAAWLSAALVFGGLPGE